MATLINAEGVCPSGGPCGGGGSAEPAVAARASNHIHAHMPPASSRVCTYVSCNKGFFYVGVCSLGCRRRHGDVSGGKCDKWHLGVAVRSGVGHRLFSHVAGVQGGPPPSFCIKSSWARLRLASASAGARGSRPIERFYFPRQRFLARHKSRSALQHRWQSHHRRLAVGKSGWRTIVFTPPALHQVCKQRRNGGGSLSKQHCATSASNAFITNCHKCGAPLTLG